MQQSGQNSTKSIIQKWRQRRYALRVGRPLSLEEVEEARVSLAFVLSAWPRTEL
jgi:hypothetical protein